MIFKRLLLRGWAKSGTAPGWLYAYLEGHGGNLSRAPIVRALKCGLRIKLDLRDHVQRQIYFFGAYEPIELSLFLRRGRGGPPPPWESSCRTRTGPVEADGTVDAQNAPTAPWKTLRVFHELPQGLSHRITHAKPRKAPKWRWETRIDPLLWRLRTD